MRLSRQIKPVSYLKAHAAEVVRTLAAQHEPLIITQNGEAKAVMQSIDSYEQMQETLALLNRSRSWHLATGTSKPATCDPPPMSWHSFGSAARLPRPVDR